MNMGAVRKSVLRVTEPIHARLRAQKVGEFLELVGSDAGCESLLDVGGSLGISGEFIPLYRAFSSVTIVNLGPGKRDGNSGVPIKRVVGDGCSLPFASGSFDWVFSNAVIEHVGSSDRQKNFASEIERVAKRGYFIATPNKYFPVEPHYYIPFYQFMPEWLQRRLIPFAPGFGTEYRPIILLTASEFHELFPNSRVRKTGFPYVPMNLIAYWKLDTTSC